MIDIAQESVTFNAVKTKVTVPVDTYQADMGVAALMKGYEPFLKLPGMRVRVAEEMTKLFRHQTTVSRQMLEKWQREVDPITPSTRMFLAFLIAVETIEKRETTKAK